MKKIISLIVSAATAAVLFTACSAGKTDQGKETNRGGYQTEANKGSPAQETARSSNPVQETPQSGDPARRADQSTDLTYEIDYGTYGDVNTQPVLRSTNRQQVKELQKKPFHTGAKRPGIFYKKNYRFLKFATFSASKKYYK